MCWSADKSYLGHPLHIELMEGGICVACEIRWVIWGLCLCFSQAKHKISLNGSLLQNMDVASLLSLREDKTKRSHSLTWRRGTNILQRYHTVPWHSPLVLYLIRFLSRSFPFTFSSLHVEGVLVVVGSFLYLFQAKWTLFVTVVFFFSPPIGAI